MSESRLNKVGVLSLATLLKTVSGTGICFLVNLRDILRAPFL